MNKKKFYEEHRNFSWRTITEYLISPGIRCKFDLIKEQLGSRNFYNGIDLGCSGNSFIYFLENFIHKSFFDIALLPLNQYSKLIQDQINDEEPVEVWHPLCGDLISLPYKDKTFDFISALDVLEHIKNDEKAISEISRILKKNGIAVITVPHRMKFFTNQDTLIGHYRRYEIEQITSLFERYNLKRIKMFGVYGRFMRIVFLQSINPKKTEKSLQKLRIRYNSDIIFRNIWKFFTIFLTKLMKIDAKYNSLKNIRNIAFIFMKEI